MIKEIILQDFRSIRNLEFKAKAFNVIQGPRGSGKSSFLEAIALTDHSDDEFYTILKQSFHEPNRQMELRELIQLNFFSHRRSQESMKVKIRFYETPTRKLELWRTDDDQARSLGMSKAIISPFIFVYESSDLRKLQPRAVQYSQVDKIYREMRTTVDKWPINFVGPDRVFSLALLTKHYKVLRSNPHYRSALLAMMDQFEDVSAIGLHPYGKSETVMVKFKDREQMVPLHGCDETFVRVLTILTFLCSSQKNYFLIDNIEKSLTDVELDWLVSQVVQLALVRGIQIFVTSKNERVNDLFEKALRNKDYTHHNLDLGRIRNVSSLHEDVVT